MKRLENENMKFYLRLFRYLSRTKVASIDYASWDGDILRILQYISLFVTYTCHSLFPALVLKLHFLKMSFRIESFQCTTSFLYSCITYLLLQCVPAPCGFSMFFCHFKNIELRKIRLCFLLIFASLLTHLSTFLKCLFGIVLWT